MPSADAWWEQVTVLAGPLAGRLAALPDDVRRAARAAAVAAVADHAEPVDGGVRIPGVALLAWGRRAG